MLLHTLFEEFFDNKYRIGVHAEVLTIKTVYNQNTLKPFQIIYRGYLLTLVSEKFFSSWWTK